MDLSEHEALMQDTVASEYGRIAAAITETLTFLGPSTLKEIGDKLTLDPISQTRTASAPPAASVRDDGAMDERHIRQAMALLVQHEIVKYDEDDKTYSVLIEKALLRSLFPLFANHVVEKFGEAGQAIMRVLCDHHVASLDAIVSAALHRLPALSTAVQETLAQMRRQLILVPANEEERKEASHSRAGSLGGVGNASTDEPAAKRRCLETSVRYELNYSQLLQEIRHRLIQDMVKQHYGAMAKEVTSIIEVLAAHDVSRHPRRIKHTSNGFEMLARASTPISVNALQQECDAALSATNFTTVFSTLVSDYDPFYSTGGGLVVTDCTNGQPAQAWLNYANLAYQWKMQLCEAIVFARHGTLGVRIVKILLQKTALEDRFIAEEAMATQNDTRTKLMALMRDGIVYTIELPRTTSLERNPKTTIFLYSVSDDHLLKVGRKNAIKAMRNAKSRLDAESMKQPTQQQQPPSAALRALANAYAALQKNVLMMEFL